MTTFDLNPVAIEVGELFKTAGYEIYLVGGSVRDIFLKRQSYDLDFTTNAYPDEILKIIKPWADATWDIGKDFGTIGATKKDADNTEVQIEITTYRSEKYDIQSRKPDVKFGDNINDDLSRRDFTINSIAISLPDKQLVDPYGGLSDLARRQIKTPQLAELSFSDDPLRMLRAARFASTLEFSIDDHTAAAMKNMAERIEMISAERVRDELVKLMSGAAPTQGIEILVNSGLASFILPEVNDLTGLVDDHNRHKDVYQHTLTVLKQAQDLEESSLVSEFPDFVLRFAALLHDIGKLKTRKYENDGSVTFRNHDIVGAKMARDVMKRLKFDNETIKAVYRLIELHMRFYGYGQGQWTDSAVRRYVTDAADQLQRLHYLTRADVTTKNKKKALTLQRAYDDLEERIAELFAREALDAIRPELNGQEIMEILNIKPGPDVGKAYKFLLEKRMEEGPHTPQEAREALLQWWNG